MKHLLLIAVLALTGCAHTTTVYEVSLGQNVGGVVPWGSPGDFAGPSDVANLAITVEHDNGTFCEYRHTSHLTAGRPFNDVQEDQLDAISCGYKLRVRRQ